MGILGKLFGVHDQGYICEECGGPMEFEDEWEDGLVCPKCGWSISSERYGVSDDEYDALYPSAADVLGYDEELDEDDDEDGNEKYEEVYGELSDD